MPRRSALAMGLLAAVLAGCSSSPSTGLGQFPSEPTFGHVHGLGIDAGDGSLYAATHMGVYRIVDGRPEPVGDTSQDTMGFTAAGPARFLGSGHPDFRKNPLPTGTRPLLGLMESTNAAQSWQLQSLQGQVDFHALAFVNGMAYGADATGGRFMVSEDLKSWDTRSAAQLVAVAADPANRDVVLGATETGLTRSTDGGRSWADVAGAPALQFVSWDASAGLWGATADGAVFESSDGGLTWQQQGKVSGKAQALLAHPTGIYVATDAAIEKTTDGAATFRRVVEVQG